MVDEVTAMYESDPNYKDIKSIAEMPAEEKQLLKDIYQVDYDLPGTQLLQKKLLYGKL